MTAYKALGFDIADIRMLTTNTIMRLLYPYTPVLRMRMWSM